MYEVEEISFHIENCMIIAVHIEYIEYIMIKR